MGCSWTSATLRDLIAYIGKGIAPRYTEDRLSGVMVLGQKCIRNWSVDYRQARLHSEAEKSFKDEKIVRIGDIFVNATGVGSAGRVAQVIETPNRKCITDGHVITLRPKGINPYYLGYFVKMKQPIIEQMAEGSTGQTEMNRTRLQDEIVVTFPENPKTQSLIADFFLSIDRKIEFNNQINDYLAA